MKDMTLSKALMLLFIAEIVGIFGGIPVVGIVAFVLNLLALYAASQHDGGYKTAFILSIAGIVVSVITTIVGDDSLIGALLSIVSTVINLGILYYVVASTVTYLDAVGAAGVAAKGITAWKINLICTIASVVIALLAFIPVINILAALLAVVSGIVALVGAILYLIFLYQSSKALA